MTNVSNLPVDIDFDLDAYERPADEIIAPFKTVVGGRVLTFTDPSDIDWQDALTLEEPTQLFRFTLSDDDREHLYTESMPSWKLNVLMERVMKHFKLAERVEKARQEERRASIRTR